MFYHVSLFYKDNIDKLNILSLYLPLFIGLFEEQSRSFMII